MEARHERLVAIMEQLAAGDRAGVVALYSEFGAPIAFEVRRHLRDMGVDAACREDVDGLVIDACFALADCASGWDPAGGAAPWTWGRARIRSVVASWVGVHADGLDDARVAVLPAVPACPGREPLPLEVLNRSGEALCVLLRDALVEASVPVRNQALLLDFSLQAVLGDASPALTVASLHGMKPPAVRQAVKRTKDRLRRLAREDARFAPLGELALLA